MIFAEYNGGHYNNIESCFEMNLGGTTYFSDSEFMSVAVVNRQSFHKKFNTNQPGVSLKSTSRIRLGKCWVFSVDIPKYRSNQQDFSIHLDVTFTMFRALYWKERKHVSSTTGILPNISTT